MISNDIVRLAASWYAKREITVEEWERMTKAPKKNSENLTILVDDPNAPMTQRQLDAMTYWMKPENRFFGKSMNEILNNTEILSSRACYSGDAGDETE